MNTTPSPSPSQTTLRLTLDWRIISAVLLIIIGAMLVLWQPWRSTAASTKTVSVRGQATIEHAPDVYRFQPLYVHEDLNKVTETGNAAVAKLKELGVKDADIKTTVSGGAKSNGGPEILIYPPRSASTYNINLTVNNKDLAQKVATYLASSGATGLITPQSDFSKATRDKLDLEARKQASADAKAKAQAMAEQLGSRLGKVTKISEDGGSGFAPDARSAEDKATNSAASPTIQPGLNQLTYSFVVTFELK